MISELLKTVLDYYDRENSEFNNLLTMKKQKKRIDELSVYSVASQKGYITPSILRHKLPDLIREKVSLTQEYSVTGSAGNGYMPEVPHVCILHKAVTNSPKKGFYVVYLFDVRAKRIFLSLNQGFTQYKDVYGEKNGRLKARRNALGAQKLLRPVFGFDLNELPMLASGKLANGYKKANICSKTYTYDNIPTDSELITDLKNLLGVYRELKGFAGNSIFDIECNVSENDFQEDIQGKKGKTPPPGPVEKAQSTPSKAPSTRQKRNSDFSAQALINARYQCENEIGHATFITKYGHQFVEAHHLIPLEFQEKFKYSLDVPENIISLCPNCHRAFHHSEDVTKNKLIDKFLNLRVKSLKTREIYIDPEKLKRLYKRIKEEEAIRGLEPLTEPISSEV